MSGFIAELRTDGAPADPELLGRLTDRLAFRGPDGIRTRTVGSLAMGHALLATTPEAARECQPTSLDGEVWLVGDLRIDGRAELRAKLRSPSRSDRPEPTDADLVLLAYREWGQACVEHLIGDFAFVIWDAARRTLFAARDHFGVKLLYYLHAGGSLVLSNTLQSVRAHPAMTDRLDQGVMGSLLLWGENWDRSATTFQDMRSVPAAHALSWSAERPDLVVRPYWRLPEEGPALAYSDRRDYVERFAALLGQAVADRLRTRSAAIFMSGGIDSTMVAAVARDELARSGSDFRLSALTVVLDHLVPDREREWSSLAARHLGIPIHHFPSDHLYESWDWMLEDAAPEPEILSSNAAVQGAYDRAAAEARVVLTGFDGDRLLHLDLGALWRERLRRGQLGSLAREIGWHLRRGRVPRVGVRSALRRRRERAALFEGYPPWLSPRFEASERLRERWAEDAGRTTGASPRAGAYASLTTPAWRTALDPFDAGMTGVPLEHRHPLLDLRLIEFALALPPTPWCVDKELFRTAMRGKLPEALLRRPKEPLPGDPTAVGVQRARAPLVHDLAPELGDYVDLARYGECAASLRVDPSAAARLSYVAFNTFALNGWLRSPMRTGS